MKIKRNRHRRANEKKKKRVLLISPCFFNSKQRCEEVLFKVRHSPRITMEFHVFSLDCPLAHVSLSLMKVFSTLVSQLFVGTSNQKTSSQLTPRKTVNVENFLRVYLDFSASDESIEDELRPLVNSLEIFVDADDCLSLINHVSNEKVLLIVLNEAVVSRLQDLWEVRRIDVRCQTEEQAENGSRDLSKIHRISTDIDRIIE